LGVESVVTDNSEILQTVDKVIFPGVGEASTAMNYLRERKLDEVIKSLAQPVLGICLGMQLLCKYSEENETNCLGVLPNKVRKFQSEKLKIPHIGWNTISNLKGKLFGGIAENSYAYFVHGYYVENGEETVATCDYGIIYAASVEYKNFYAVQFHPEKSGEIGAKILESFVKL
jgi:imidazole glycerol-phosphate synthase subunit HisH